MTGKIKVGICGGGNIAHSLISVLSEFDDVYVYAPRDKFTWADNMTYDQGIGYVRHVGANKIHAPVELEALSEADIVFVSLPRFAIEGTLQEIGKVLLPGQVVVFLPAPAGLDATVADFSQRGIDTIGFQRVPYVSRIVEPGKHVWIGDVRKVTHVAFSRPDIADKWIKYFESRFVGGKIAKLASFMTFTFSNSNPLLHPSRLVELLKGGDNGRYPVCPHFYSEWTDASSELYIKADAEMFEVFKAYDEKSALADYESALAHYESDSVQSMTRKICSIESLRPILAPWKKDEDGTWIPDYSSRYFTEDIPYGTKIIQAYAQKKGIKTPTIDRLVEEVMSRFQIT